MQFVGIDHAFQEFAGRQQMLLADKLIERFRAHPFCERLAGPLLRRHRGTKEIHSGMLTQLSRHVVDSVEGSFCYG